MMNINPIQINFGQVPIHGVCECEVCLPQVVLAKGLHIYPSRKIWVQLHISSIRILLVLYLLRLCYPLLIGYLFEVRTQMWPAFWKICFLSYTLYEEFKQQWFLIHTQMWPEFWKISFLSYTFYKEFKQQWFLIASHWICVIILWFAITKQVFVLAYYLYFYLWSEW